MVEKAVAAADAGRIDRWLAIYLAVLVGKPSGAIDRDMPLDRAALLGCAVTTGAGAIFNIAHITPGETVCVVGCGGIGLAAVNAAKIAGAGKIVALDPVPEKRALAEKLGATHTIDALSEPLCRGVS